MSNLASFHEYNHARDTGDNRSYQNTHFRCLEHGCLAEGEIGDEQRHGESDATQHSKSNNLTPANTIQHPSQPSPYSQPRKQNDPDWFTNYQTADNAETNWGYYRPSRATARGHTRVRQRENRHDEVSVPRDERVLETQHRRFVARKNGAASCALARRNRDRE